MGFAIKIIGFAGTIAINLLLVVTLTAAEENKLSDAQYVNSKGYFKIVPPAGWAALEFRDDPRGKVKFVRSSTPNTTLLIVGQASPFTTIEELLDDATQSAERLKNKNGASTVIETTSFAGVPAVRLTIEMSPNVKQMQIQFILGSNYYTIAYGSTPDEYQQFLPIALASFETFEPILKNASKEESREHSAASKLRTATMLIQLRQEAYARTVIDEGLSLEPNNKQLMILKQSLPSVVGSDKMGMQTSNVAKSNQVRKAPSQSQGSQTLMKVLPDALAIFFVVAGDFKEEQGNLNAKGSVQKVLRDIGFKVVDRAPSGGDAQLEIKVTGENISIDYTDGKSHDTGARITGVFIFQTPDGQSERRTFYGAYHPSFQLLLRHQNPSERFSKAFESSSFWDELGRILGSTYGPAVEAKYWKEVALFNSTPFVRAAALVKLVEFEEPSKDLIALILNTETSDNAIKALGEIGEIALLDLASSSDTRTRKNVIQALGLFDSKRSTEALVRALGDENPEVRRTSLLVLRTGKRDYVADLLVDSMRHGTNLQRQAAAEGLAFVNDDRAIEPLVRATRDPDKHIQKEATTSLILKGEKAIPVLGTLMKNGDTTVKAIIPETLALIGGCQALSILEQALEDPVPGVRQNALKAISSFKGKARSAC